MKNIFALVMAGALASLSSAYAESQTEKEPVRSSP